jgi:hypothetical protein
MDMDMDGSLNLGKPLVSGDCGLFDPRFCDLTTKVLAYTMSPHPYDRSVNETSNELVIIYVLQEDTGI